jgi:hypothetical protein
LSFGHTFTSRSFKRKQQACEITNGDGVYAFVFFSFLLFDQFLPNCCEKYDLLYIVLQSAIRIWKTHELAP